MDHGTFDGLTLRTIAELDDFDPVRLWGPGPMLLIRSSDPTGDAPYAFATPDDSRLAETAELVAGKAVLSYVTPGAVLVPIRKTGRSKRALQRITVGRSRVNDIRCTGPDVSKAHAYFVPPTGWPMTNGVWKLADAESLNSTFVLTGSGMTELEPSRRYHLKSGDEIRFGESVQAAFLDEDSATAAVIYAMAAWKRESDRADDRSRYETETMPRVRFANDP